MSEGSGAVALDEESNECAVIACVDDSVITAHILGLIGNLKGVESIYKNPALTITIVL